MYVYHFIFTKVIQSVCSFKNNPIKDNETQIRDILIFYTVKKALRALIIILRFKSCKSFILNCENRLYVVYMDDDDYYPHKNFITPLRISIRTECAFEICKWVSGYAAI